METLAPHIQYYRDRDWNTTLARISGSDAPLFQPLNAKEPNFGYTKDKIWLRFKVSNNNKDTEDFRLHIRENFLQNLTIHTQHGDGRIVEILSQDRASPFSSRPIAYPEIVAPLQVKSGETVTIYLSYWSEGSSQISFSIDTAQEFIQSSYNKTAKHFLYYGMVLSLIIGAIVLWVVWRAKEALAYTLYASSSVLFLAHIEGVAFQYIWPNSPQFNSVATIIVGTVFSVTCVNFARIYLQTKLLHPRMNMLLLFVIAANLCVATLGSIIDLQFAKRALVALALISILSSAIAGIVAGRTRFREVRFYICAWVASVFAAGIMSLNHVLSFEISQIIELEAVRIAIVFDALMLSLGVADRYDHLRMSRQSALEESLGTAQRNLALKSRLYELQERYNRAMQSAIMRDQNIQNTVHDLRQPLQALRLNIENVKNVNTDASIDGQQIEKTFQYLETLISSHLEETLPTDKTHFQHVLQPNQALTVPKILDTIYDMFLPDAKEKGLEFNYDSTTHHVDVAPLAVMRIVTNLVSNAIKYTDQGTITLGAQLTKDTLVIHVHDTGIGMSEAQFKHAQKRAVRLEHNTLGIEGQGYGLAIAHDLANIHGMELSRDSQSSAGTQLSLSIPRGL